MRPAEATADPADTAAREASLTLDTLRSEIAGLENKRAELTEDVEDLTRQVDLERAKLESVNQNVQRAGDKKRKVREEIAALRVEEADEIAKHQKALEALATKQEQQRVAFTKKLEADHEQLVARVQELEDQAAQLEALRRRREAEYKHEEAQLEKLRVELRIVDKQVDDRRALLADLSKKLSEAHATIEAAKRARERKDG